MSIVTEQRIAQRFRSLAVWSKGGQRAPHKPLLCLLAISKLVNEDVRLLRFSEIERSLRDLLAEFGPPRKVSHPEYPFAALQNEDDLWDFRTAATLPKRVGGSPTRAQLIRCDAQAGFRPAVYRALKIDPALRGHVITVLLDSHFPESLHDDILDALALTASPDLPTSHDRDPEFREKILSAYDYRCAVCGFNVRIGHMIVALEAAHIKWHQAGGPDAHENGLALCCLHHKLFDRGAFTVDEECRALISERAYGTDGFAEHLGRFHKQPLLKPKRDSYRPKHAFLQWHMSQVFARPSRE